MSSLPQSDKYALAWQLVAQLTGFVDGTTFANRMTVLRNILEAWEQNQEVTMVTENTTFATFPALDSPNPADVMVKQEVDHTDNTWDVAQSSCTSQDFAHGMTYEDQASECPRGHLDSESLFEELGNNRAQVTVMKLSLDGSQEEENPSKLPVGTSDDNDPGGVCAWQGGGKAGPFECNICTRSFQFGAFSAELPFHCPHCQCSASPTQQRGAMRRSDRTTKPPCQSPTRNTLAQIASSPCPQGFTQEDNLIKHIKTHNETFCTETESTSHASMRVSQNDFGSNQRSLRSTKQTQSPSGPSEPRHRNTEPHIREPRSAAFTQTCDAEGHGHADLHGLFHCETCQDVLPTQLALAQHIKMQHKPSSAKKARRDSSTIAKSQKQDESHSAEVSSFVSSKTNRSDVKRTYCCKYCSATLSSPKCLRYHENLHISNPSMIRKRGKMMSAKRTLPSTSRSQMHTKKVPEVGLNTIKTLPRNRDLFKCQYCGKQHRSRWHKVEHETVHTDERPFQCKICKLQVKRKSVLNRHVKFCHPQVTVKKANKVGSRRHQCEVCSQVLSSAEKLARHEKLHSGASVSGTNSKRKLVFRCGYCDKVTTRLDLLLGHERLHRGERPFSCVCGRAYSTRHALRKHQRSHCPLNGQT